MNDNNKYFSVETPHSTSPIPVSHLNKNASIEAREDKDIIMTKILVWIYKFIPVFQIEKKNPK